MQLQLFHLSYEPLFHDVQLSLESPGIYLLYGRSGCGKTTLLHLISKLIIPDSGEILINGNSIMNQYTFDSATFYSDLLTIGFQNAYAIDDYQLEDYLHLYGFQNSEILAVLTRLDLMDVMHLKIGHLSLGQRQRAALALITLIHPSIVLLDEPTASLDRRHIELCKELFLELAKSSIVIIASHQLDFYQPISNALLQIENGAISLCFNKEAQKKTDSFPKTRIQVSHFYRSMCSLHLKNYLLLYLQIVFTLFLILSISLFFYWLLDSADCFIDGYANYYPDLYVLEVSNTTIDELIEIGGYDTLLVENLEEEYTCSLWEQQTILKEGTKPEKGEVVISQDINLTINDSIIIGENDYIISGIVKNDFNNNTIYFLEDDYLEGNDQGYYLVAFENKSKMLKNWNLYEKKYFKVENTYQSMCESVHSIVQGIRLYVLLIFLFAGSFTVMILMIQLKTLFSRYAQEILDLYLHGISLVQEKVLYIAEAIVILMISLAVSLGFIHLSEGEIVNYIETNYTSFSVLLPFNQFLTNNGLNIFELFFILILITVIVELTMIYHYFHYSISKRIKEDEGC